MRRLLSAVAGAWRELVDAVAWGLELRWLGVVDDKETE